MPSPNNVLTADSYIQDGLVFQLDGIEYGGRADGWLDRKGNIFFRSSKGSDLHDGNRFKISPLLGYLQAENLINFPAAYKIEVAISNMVQQGWGGIVSLNKSLAVYRNADTRLCYKDISNFYTSPSGINSRSGGGIIHNGRLFTTQGGSVSMTSLTSATIGRLYQGPYFVITGSVYAIRVYSRQLSDREILINQKIDNARFQLGLSIPDEVLPATRSLSLSEPFELPDESMTEQYITNENSDER